MFSRLSAPAELEELVLQFWDSNRIFERVLAQGEGRPSFIFYEGPPTANGTPHNGHVLTRVMKDVFPRYKTMQGYHVDRKAGWDTHGLPVEVEVEKRLDIHGREAITAFGLEKFSRECVNSVFTYVRDWEELTKQIGFWVDLEQAYVTFHRSYVESVWWALSELFNKGLLYQGHKVVWWWPQGGTTLSALEVGLGYKEVDDPAVTIRFTDAQRPNRHYLAWTTTPWTLPSNVALAVAEAVDYAICDDPNDPGAEVVLAAARAEVYGLTPKELVKGTELIGRQYVGLYRFENEEFPTDRANVIVGGHHVTTDSGAGIVHIAPAFGEDDMEIAKQQQLMIRQWLNPSGKFPENPLSNDKHTVSIAGVFCKDADKEIIRDLKERGLLFKRDTYRHPYPFCWRADQDPLIQYARPAWFIRTTSAKQEVLANNAAVNWHPEHMQEGRFGDFLRNNVDWALSRERFWGTPLNIWTCEACGHRIAPASTAAIRELNPNAFDPSVDEHLQVHRPWIDNITLPCSQCQGTMQRVSEVIDCWFDSGCMPFAQWGWPHQGKEKFEKNFPADFISEAVDQTRGWFYSLMMISTLLFDSDTCKKYGLSPVGMPRPYRNCMVLGHVCDMDGRKESKSKGNYTSPNLVLRGKTSIDALPDPTLARNTVGLKADQIPSLDISSKDRVTISDPKAKSSISAQVVAAKVKPKDTIHLHPDDLEALGVSREGGRVWFATPGEPPGADAFRWLFCASNAPWSNTRLSVRTIREAQREFLMRLRNVYQFFSIYAAIAYQEGQFNPATGAPRSSDQRHLLDRWILHQLQRTVEDTTRSMDDYRLYETTQSLKSFVDDLSNWYVRRSRDRFWNTGPQSSLIDMQDALWTLYECLVTFSKLSAPFVPFTAEALWQALVPAGEQGSVHLMGWPKSAVNQYDEVLAADMALVRDLVSLGLAARASAKLKVRQPLHQATIILADPSRQASVEALKSIITEELNIHDVVFAPDAAHYVSFTVKPDFKRLGARLGKDMKAVAAAVTALDPEFAKRSLDKGNLTVTVDGREFSLVPEDVLITISPKGEFQASSSPNAVVVVSTLLDDALIQEGWVRELTNRIQNIRKELDLGYTQRISVSLDGDPELIAASRMFEQTLTRETLTTSLRYGAPEAQAEIRETEVEGRPVQIGVLPL